MPPPHDRAQRAGSSGLSDLFGPRTPAITVITENTNGLTLIINRVEERFDILIDIFRDGVMIASGLSGDTDMDRHGLRSEPNALLQHSEPILDGHGFAARQANVVQTSATSEPWRTEL